MLKITKFALVCDNIGAYNLRCTIIRYRIYNIKIQMLSPSQNEQNLLAQLPAEPPIGIVLNLY
jgi:hypothetical protein